VQDTTRECLGKPCFCLSKLAKLKIIPCCFSFELQFKVLANTYSLAVS